MLTTTPLFFIGGVMHLVGIKNEIMKHTKNYMDAKWVIENPEKYGNRDVARANSFIEAYNEGYNKALSLGGDVGRSEQLKALLSKVVDEFDSGEVTWDTRDEIENVLKSL